MPRLCRVCPRCGLPPIGTKMDQPFFVVPDLIFLSFDVGFSDKFPHGKVSLCLVRRRYQHIHFFGFHNSHNSIIHGCKNVFLFLNLQSKFITPIRNSRVNTDLILYGCSAAMNGLSAPLLAAVVRNTAPLPCTPLPGCLVDNLVHSLCVCDLCRVRVLVRLSRS